MPPGRSADLWRLTLPGHDGRWVVKQPRARLRAVRDWQASTERAAIEARFLETMTIRGLTPVPALIGFDPATRLLVTRHHAAPAWRPWSRMLQAGRVDPGHARTLGMALGRIHAGSRDEPALLERFAADDLLRDLRIRPLLHVTARAHPDLAGELKLREEELGCGPRALIHGDPDPADLLLDDAGAGLLLDGECACRGAPHLDLALAQSHLLLAWAKQPQRAGAWLTAVRTLSDAWRTRMDADGTAMAERAARLLPALLLAAVDGLAPDPELTAERRGRLRSFARTQLRVAPDRTDLLLRRFERAMGDID
ncbi:MAG: hypothetical protein U5R48_17605 [Gammaproteobacteria bacterium]|nr:hypothetical protein [Gammaproteobacteria bacterium]